MFKKIAVIGNAGSGKTTLAKKLAALLHVPLYHLDQYFFSPSWQEVPKEEFKAKHDELCNLDVWVLEGCSMKTVPDRLAKADMIIYLKTPRWRCMFNILRRAVCNHGRVRECSPAGCPENMFNRKFLKLLRYVWNFNKRFDAGIQEQLNLYKDEKPVYYLYSYEQIDDFLNTITKEF